MVLLKNNNVNLTSFYMINKLYQCHFDNFFNLNHTGIIMIILYGWLRKFLTSAKKLLTFYVLFRGCWFYYSILFLVS